MVIDGITNTLGAKAGERKVSSEKLKMTCCLMKGWRLVSLRKDVLKAAYHAVKP